MTKFSIKRVKRLIGEEKPKALGRYLRGFIAEDKRSKTEVRIDEYAHELVKKGYVEKSEVLKKLSDIEGSV
jgi:hypothetical protein